MKFLSNRRVSPFLLGVFFTLARVSLALLSLRKNGDYSWSMSRPVHQSLFPGLPPKAPLSLRETSRRGPLERGCIFLTTSAA